MPEKSAYNFTALKDIVNEFLPQRVLLCIFGFLAIVNAYTMRLSLDIAMTHMIVNQNIVPTQTIELEPTGSGFSRPWRIAGWSLPRNATLQRLPIAPSTTIPVSDTFDWSTQLQNFISTAFYVGYMIGQVPAGQLAEKYGGKWVLGVGIFITALLTLLTPAAIKVGGPIALIVMRLLIGLSESPTYPALSALLAKWVPACERGKLGVLVLSAGEAGVFTVNFVSSLLLHWFNWSLIFYFFGCCALLWVIFFAHFCYSDPETHPSIKEQEKHYLREEIKCVTPKEELAPTPWRAIFSSVPMWALISATVQHDWNQYDAVSKLLQGIKQLPLKDNLSSSVNVSMPYILKWLVSLSSGVVVDALITHNILSTSGARKIMTSIAAFGPQLFQGFVSCFSCEQEKKGFLSMLQCAFGVVGTYYAGIKLTPLDMSPNYAGTLMGIANGIGSVSALVAPYWEKLMPVQLSNIKEFRSLLWIACTLLSSGEVQPFNSPNCLCQHGISSSEERFSETRNINPSCQENVQSREEQPSCSSKTSRRNNILTSKKQPSDVPKANCQTGILTSEDRPADTTKPYQTAFSLSVDRRTDDQSIDHRARIPMNESQLCGGLNAPPGTAILQGVAPPDDPKGPHRRSGMLLNKLKAVINLKKSYHTTDRKNK